MNDRWWRSAFLTVAVLAGVALLGLGLGATFFSDEWAFIEGRSLSDPAGWFRPHNEHWVTLSVVLYRLMVETLGIGSYVPFQVAVIVLHLGVAGLVFRLVARRSGAPWGFLGGSLVAFLGAGFENLFWGFQVGFVGSVLLGLAAVDVSDGEPSRSRALIVVGLLVLSLMASGTGVAMCITVGVFWLLDVRWRRRVLALAIPATAYVGWLALFGRAGISTMRNPFTLEAAADIPHFLAWGFGDAAASITGLASVPGVLAAGLILAWAIVRMARGTIPPLAGGALVAIAAQYALIGLVRGGLGEGQVHYTRYTYVAGILLLLAVSSLAGQPRLPQAVGPRRLLTTMVGATVVLAFLYNGILLVGGRTLFLERADMTRALLVAGLRRPLPPETDPSRTLVLVPSPLELARITQAYGEARRDWLASGFTRGVPPAVQAEADRRVREGAEVPLPEDR